MESGNLLKLKIMPRSLLRLGKLMGQREPSPLSHGDVFYDITHIKNITNGIMGQSIIADAQSIDDGNSIADAEIDVNPDTQFSTRTTEDDVASMSIEEMDCAYMDAMKSSDEQWDRENCPRCPERTVPYVPDMQSNGEFSVIDLYRSDAVLYNRTTFEDMDFVDKWKEMGYDAKELIRWAATIDENAGKAIFEQYDRMHLRFVPVDSRKEEAGNRTAYVHRRGSYGEGILETDTNKAEGSNKVTQYSTRATQTDIESMSVKRLDGAYMEVYNSSNNARMQMLVDEVTWRAGYNIRISPES